MVSSRSFSPGSARPRWATPGTPGRPHLAGKVAWTATALGFDGLMSHQRRIIATGTEQLRGGRPAFRQVTVEEPRQQGKSVSILSLMLTRGIEKPGTMISYSAQTRLAGRRRMLDVWWPRIRRSRGLRKLVDVRRGYGSEAYLFANGSMLMLASGTQTSDHGDTLDLAVIDEAWAQRDDTIEDGRAMAELGATDTAAYFGYSAPDDADPVDPATWYGCMPALGITVSEETVRADFGTMPLAEFRRAYLCQWPEVAKPGWEVISQQTWETLGYG